MIYVNKQIHGKDTVQHTHEFFPSLIAKDGTVKKRFSAKFDKHNNVIVETLSDDPEEIKREVEDFLLNELATIKKQIEDAKKRASSIVDLLGAGEND